MARLLGNCSRLEVRAMNRFLWAKNLPESEIHSQIMEVYVEEAMNRQHVEKLCHSNQSDGKYVENGNMTVSSWQSSYMTEVNTKNSLVYVALYHIHHIWNYRVRLRESDQPIGRLRKTCKNAFPRTIPVSFDRLDTPTATESCLNVNFFKFTR
ncbi:hypothetical protein TNCV_235241 [Trichonephila clavipes]|uniref:Uncharacterized protein n=1 Tax=Trichonephila clavipes TaxID=2585209 RepID=A0A8X6VJD1_TRICX|nr:hypothetical protein TNCV_235241 [Trichonephila clavipes]